MSIIVKEKKKKYTAWDKGLVAISIFMMSLVFYPLWYVLINAVSNLERGQNDTKIWFVNPDLMAFKTILYDLKFYRAVAVTLFFAVTCIFVINVANLFVAYPLAKRNLKAKGFVKGYLIVSMYFGGGFIPQFILMHHLGLYNTPWAIILPYACASMGLVALYKTFIHSVAEDLMDAAMIDGASNLGILFRIVIPAIKPAIAVQVMTQFIAQWNSWFGINVYLPDRKWQNIQLYLTRLLDGMAAYDPTDLEELNIELSPELLKQLQDAWNNATRIRYASMLLVALPLLIMYPFIQKNLQQGMMIGSLKG